jgi:hypothetical protein
MPAEPKIERFAEPIKIEQAVRTIEPNALERKNVFQRVELNPFRHQIDTSYDTFNAGLAETNYHSNVVAASSYELDSLKSTMNSLNEMLEKQKKNKEANDLLNVDIEKFNTDFDKMTDQEAISRFNLIKGQYAKYDIRLETPKSSQKNLKKALQKALENKKTSLYNDLTAEKIQKKINEISEKYNNANIRHDSYRAKFEKALEKVKEGGVKASEAETNIIADIVENKWYRTSTKGNQMRAMLDYINIDRYSDSAFTAQAGNMDQTLFNRISKIRKMRKLKKQAEAMETRASMINESIFEASKTFDELTRNKSELDISLGIGVTAEAKKSIRTVETNRFNLILDSLASLPITEFDTGDADKNKIYHEFLSILKDNKKPIKGEAELLTELNKLYEKYPIFINSIKSRLRGEGTFQENILKKLEDSAKSAVDLSLEERTRQLNAIDRLRQNGYTAKFNAHLRFNMKELIKTNSSLNKIVEAYNKANPKNSIDLNSESSLTSRYNEILKKPKGQRLNEENALVSEYESMKNTAIKISRETLNMSDISKVYNKNISLLNKLAQSKDMNVTFSVPPSLEDYKNLNLLFSNATDNDFKSIFTSNDRAAMKQIKRLLQNKIDLNNFTSIIESSLTTLPSSEEIKSGITTASIEKDNRYLSSFMQNLKDIMKNRNEKPNTPVGEKIDIKNNIAKYGSEEFAAVVTYANTFKKIIDPVNVGYVDFEGKKKNLPNESEARTHLTKLVSNSTLLPEIKAKLIEVIESSSPLILTDLNGKVKPLLIKELTNQNLESFLNQTLEKFNKSDDLTEIKAAIIKNFGFTNITNPVQLALQLEQLKSFILSDKFTVTPTNTASSSDKKNALISKIIGNDYTDIFHEELFEDPTAIQNILRLDTSSINSTAYVNYINILSRTLSDIKQKQSDNDKRLLSTADPQSLEKYTLFKEQYKTLIEEITTRINTFNKRENIEGKFIPEDPNFENKLSDDLKSPAYDRFEGNKTALNTFSQLTKDADYDTYVGSNVKDIAGGTTEMTNIQNSVDAFKELYQAKLDEETRLGIGHEYSTYLYNKYIQPAMLMQQKIAAEMSKLYEINNKEFTEKFKTAETTKTALNELLAPTNDAVGKYNKEYSEFSTLGTDFLEYTDINGLDLNNEFRLLNGNKDPSKGPISTNIMELNNNITDSSANIDDIALNSNPLNDTNRKTLNDSINDLINDLDDENKLPDAKLAILRYMEGDSSGAAINAFYNATRTGKDKLLKNDQEFIEYFELDTALPNNNPLITAFINAKCFNLNRTSPLTYIPQGSNQPVNIHNITGDINVTNPNINMQHDSKLLSSYISNVSNAVISISKVNEKAEKEAIKFLNKGGNNTPTHSEITDAQNNLLAGIKNAYTEKHAENEANYKAIIDLRNDATLQGDIAAAIVAAKDASVKLAKFKFDATGNFKTGNYEFNLLNDNLRINESVNTSSYLVDYNELLGNNKDDNALKQTKIALLQNKYQYQDLDLKIDKIKEFLNSKGIDIDPKFIILQKNLKAMSDAIGNLKDSNKTEIAAKEANIRLNNKVPDLNNTYTELIGYLTKLKIKKNKDLSGHKTEIDQFYNSLQNKPVTELLKDVDINKDLQSSTDLNSTELAALFDIQNGNNLLKFINNQQQVQQQLQTSTSGGSRKVLTKLRKRARSVMRNKDARVSKRSAHRKHKKNYKARKTHRA